MLRVPAPQHNLRGRQQSSWKPDQALAIHKPPSPSAEAAAHLLPQCLLPPSGLHPAMQEEETPATKPVKGREEDSGKTGLGTPQDGKPTLPHLGPHGGHPERSQDLEAKRVRAARPGTLRSLTASRRPLPAQPGAPPRPVPPHSDRTSPVPRESPGPAPRRDKAASTPQGGAKFSYPLAPRGPLSGREQEGELFQGDCSDLGPFSFPSASEPPPPCSSQGSASLPPKCRGRDASPGARSLVLRGGGLGRGASNRGVSANRDGRAG